MRTTCKRLLTKILALVMATGFFSIGVQTPALADMVSTEQVYTSTMIEQKRSEIQSLTAREDVARSLSAYGVSPEDIGKRIASMTDTEVLEFHAEMDNLPAGEGVLGTVIALLVIFILLDLAGVTDIFPGV